MASFEVEVWIRRQMLKRIDQGLQMHHCGQLSRRPHLWHSGHPAPQFPWPSAPWSGERCPRSRALSPARRFGWCCRTSLIPLHWRGPPCSQRACRPSLDGIFTHRKSLEQLLTTATIYVTNQKARTRSTIVISSSLTDWMNARYARAPTTTTIITRTKTERERSSSRVDMRDDIGRSNTRRLYHPAACRSVGRLRNLAEWVQMGFEIRAYQHTTLQWVEFSCFILTWQNAVLPYPLPDLIWNAVSE